MQYTLSLAIDDPIYYNNLLMNYISKVGPLYNVIMIENIVHKFSHIYKVCVTDSNESGCLA